MLFILGLTYFVSVIAQTRSWKRPRVRFFEAKRGKCFPPWAILAGLSGVLRRFGGVSMIGLMIRTLVIILALGARKRGTLFLRWSSLPITP